MSVRNVDSRLAKDLGLEPGQGVVITDVQPGSLAARAGLEADMMILSMNGIKHFLFLKGE